MAALLRIIASLAGPKESPQRIATLALIRLSLGIAQMSMAVASFMLLITQGVQKLTLTMVACTTTFTIVSRLLFYRLRQSERKNRIERT